MPASATQTASTTPHPLGFLDGGGELGALCRKKDWAATPLGPPTSWPQSLQTAVSMVLTSTFPMIVLWGPELIQIYNDAYRLIMGRKHPGGLGQRTRDCWPEAWHINEAIYPRIFAGETIAFTEAVYPLEPNGVKQDFVFTLSYNPVRAEGGVVGGVLVTLVDVTAEVQARKARIQAEAQARAERQRLYEVFLQVPALVAVLEGPEHRFTVANDRYKAILGGREVTGKTVVEAIPEIVGQGFVELLDQVRQTGKPFVAQNMEAKIDRTGTGRLDTIFVDFVYQPLRDTEGHVFGVMIHAVETTEQVVARKRIESLAAEREAMLAQVADGVITYDSQARITFINDLARELMPQVEVGKSFAEQADHIHICQLDGTPFPPNGSPSGRAQKGERVHDVEWLSKPPGGAPRRLRGSAVPVYDASQKQLGVVLTCRDVTEQHRLQQNLEFERNRLRTVFAQAPAAITVVRGKEHVVDVINPMAAQMTGHRDALGKPIREVFPELEGQGFFELLDRVLLTGEPFVGNEVPARIARNGRVEEGFFNFVYQPMLDESGKAFGVMSHSVEVTDIVQARKLAEERAAQLARLTAELEASNKDLDQFAYVASHDLKAPLRGIANLTTWIQEDTGDGLSQQSREHMKLLLGRVHRMEALIDGILTYSRAGRSLEPSAEVDTRVLVNEVVELLSPPAGVKVELDPQLPTVRAERTPLQQVFLNLIGNAIKYAGRGRPSARVEVKASDRGSAYQFTVTDDGPGIPPEYHDRIWGIFQTLQSRDAVEGTGIGLSVVRKVVETRGGKVWIESSLGQGASFHFTWPK